MYWYQKDWYMRQIEMMGQTLGQIISLKSVDVYQKGIIDDHSEITTLQDDLMQLVDHLQINQAENMLFDQINCEDNRYIEVALAFYLRLNELTDQQLEESHFSREEIASGLGDIMAMFDA